MYVNVYNISQSLLYFSQLFKTDFYSVTEKLFILCVIPISFLILITFFAFTS